MAWVILSHLSLYIFYIISLYMLSLLMTELYIHSSGYYCRNLVPEKGNTTCKTHCLKYNRVDTPLPTQNQWCSSVGRGPIPMLRRTRSTSASIGFHQQFQQRLRNLFICNTDNLTMQFSLLFIYSYPHFHCTDNILYQFFFLYVMYHLLHAVGKTNYLFPVHTITNCPHLHYYTLYKSITLVSAD